MDQKLPLDDRADPPGLLISWSHEIFPASCGTGGSAFSKFQKSVFLSRICRARPIQCGTCQFDWTPITAGEVPHHRWGSACVVYSDR